MPHPTAVLANRISLNEIVRDAAVALKKPDNQHKWLQSLAAGGVHCMADLLDIRCKRHLWHRLSIPIACKIKLEERIVEETIRYEEEMEEEMAAAAHAEASREVEKNAVLCDETGHRDRHMSFVSSTVLDVLSHETDAQFAVPQYRVPENFGQLTQEEMLATASLIGMIVDAGAIDRVTTAHEQEAAAEGCSFNAEDIAWMDTVLSLAQTVHTKAVVRLYICRPSAGQWIYTGFVGGAAVVTEANLQLVCAHYLRLVDLEGWNPVSYTRTYLISLDLALSLSLSLCVCVCVCVYFFVSPLFV
jgi:hypothetical protein